LPAHPTRTNADGVVVRRGSAGHAGRMIAPGSYEVEAVDSSGADSATTSSQ
jgi:hypothetical protein